MTLHRDVLFVAIVTLVVACGPPPRARGARPELATYAVATSGNYAPFSTWEGDRPAGFAPTLLEAFAQSAGVRIAWTRFRWTDVAAGMHEGRWDVVADGITVRAERSITGTFTLPIARGGAVLLLRRPGWAKHDAGIRELDRKELRVVVNGGGHLEKVARALLHEADVRSIPDNAAVREAWARGEADAAMTNTFEAPRWASGLAGVEAIGPLTNDVTALWVGPGRESIARQLDEWLLAAERDGRLRHLRAQLLGAGAEDATATAVEGVLAATSERLALMPFVAAAKKRAGTEIEDAAQEERVLAAARAEVAREAGRAGRRSPGNDVVDAFFRAQIEAAKEVQMRAPPVDAAYDLSRELRPAIARISARMAFLLVRIEAVTSEQLRSAARRALTDTALLPATIDRLADAIAALAMSTARADARGDEARVRFARSRVRGDRSRSATP